MGAGQLHDGSVVLHLPIYVEFRLIRYAINLQERIQVSLQCKTRDIIHTPSALSEEQIEQRTQPNAKAGKWLLQKFTRDLFH
jgi:hypothetical protein